MSNIFKKGLKRAALAGNKFISVVDFFETNLFKRELGFKNPTTNVINQNNSIVFSDTFTTGNIIDTSKWTVTDTADCVSIAQVNGTGLVFTNTHGCTSTFYQNYLQSTYSVSPSTYPGVTAQANLTWTTDTTAKAVASFGLWVDTNNGVFIRTDSTAVSTDVRVTITKGGATVYDIIATGVPKGKDYRVTYNFSTYEIKVFYQSSNGKWIQFCTTQTYNIHNGNNVYFVISDLDNTLYTGAGTVTVKNTVFYNTDAINSNAYGEIVDEDFTTLGSLSGYTVVQPASTISLTGGYLRLNNAGSGGFGNYIQYDTYGSSSLSTFKEEIVFIPQNKTATSYGISLGMISTNTTASVSISGFMQLYTGGGAVQLYKNGAVLGAASSALVYSVGDSIKLIFERIENYFSIKAINMTTGTQVSTSTTVSSSVTSNTPNTVGKFVIYSNGGIQDIEYLKVQSSDNKLGKTCFVGDSITYSYSATSLRNSFSRKLTYSGTDSYNIIASVGSKTSDVLNYIDELKALAPSYYVLMIGGNDVAAGIAQATYEANYTSIVNQLKSTGAQVIHCKATPRNAFNMTTLNTFIDGFTTDTIIDTFTPLKDGGTGLNALYDFGDGTHPNDAGHTIIYNTINSAVGGTIL